MDKKILKIFGQIYLIENIKIWKKEIIIQYLEWEFLVMIHYFKQIMLLEETGSQWINLIDFYFLYNKKFGYNNT